MASKQPFKLIDVKNKLKVWSVKIKKVFQHRVLSQRRSALFIGHEPNEQFVTKLRNKLKKTWDIYDFQGGIEEMHQINSKEKNGEKTSYSRQYDAIIVMPQKNMQNYYNFEDEQFATNFTTFQQASIFNLFAYRMAHKYLATTGVVILSVCQNDFLKTQQRKEDVPPLPITKKILEAQLNYLGVTVGDRDYTDLNSWSVIGLSEELANREDNEYIVQKYAEWAEGKQLPMPGSFALFKLQEEGKKKPFVQYL